MLAWPIFVFDPLDVAAVNVLLGLLAGLECLAANCADVGYLFLTHHSRPSAPKMSIAEKEIPQTTNAANAKPS